MRILHSICLGIIVLTLAGCGPKSGPKADKEKAAGFEAGPAIWVAEDDDSRLYLFGTVQFMPDGAVWETAEVQSAFADAETVFLETDGSNSAQGETLIITQEQGLYKDGDRLSDRLDEYQKKLLIGVSNNADVPLGTLDNMKPWLASEILAVAAAQTEQLSADGRINAELARQSRVKNKSVEYLSSIEQSLSDSIDLGEDGQLAFLTNTMENFDDLGGAFKKSAEHWAEGKVAEMTNGFAGVQGQKSPEDYAEYLAARNDRWIETFTGFMEGNDDGFAAVDMAHLLGGDSLQFLLREQGYTVRRYRGTSPAD